MEIRLQKYLAQAGICSRRKAEEYILEGKITVNNNIVTELGTKVNENDIVKFKNKRVCINNEKIYIILNKPKNYITTAKDQFNRNTVMNLVKDIEYRIVPVGRLDYDTSGLLIMTNDGDLIYKITHPKHNINKTYIAKIEGIPNDDQINKFKNGLYIDGYKTSNANFEIIATNKNFSQVKITIHEGKNRQIRKMCDAINHKVIDLKRIAIANINLGNLKTGKYRYLTDEEINYLVKLASC